MHSTRSQEKRELKDINSVSYYRGSMGNKNGAKVIWAIKRSGVDKWFSQSTRNGGKIIRGYGIMGW